MPYFTMHQLRHFYASQQIRIGANMKEVQMLMGHATIHVTLDVYEHLFDEDHDQRLERANTLERELLGG